MFIQTNLTTLKRNEISIEEGDAWLELHPEKKAENLTGKLQKEPVRFGIESYEGILLDTKAKRAREAREAEEAKHARERSLKWLKEHQKHLEEERAKKHDQSQYVMAKNYMKKRITYGHAVAIGEMSHLSRSTVTRLIRDLRTDGVDILTLTQNNNAVGWVGASILRGRK